MLEYRLIYETEQIHVFDTLQDAKCDIYSFSFQYLGDEQPKFILSDKMYRDITLDISRKCSDDRPCNCIKCHKNDNELDSNSDVKYVDISSSSTKSLNHIVHWWFIDRDELTFNEIEQFHITRLINTCIPMCDSVNIYVCFDTYKDIYCSFILKYFEPYDNIKIMFSMNDSFSCEYNTFQHVFDYSGCYVMYTHFKGISCLKRADKLSQFANDSIQTELYNCDTIYNCLAKFDKNNNLGKIFYGGIVYDVSSWVSHVLFTDMSSKLAFLGSCYIIDIDLLKTEMHEIQSSINSLYCSKLNFHELLPSIFPPNKLYYSIRW